MTLLTVEGLTVTRQRRERLSDVSFAVGAGELVGLIGPNGAGKTTCLRAMQGLLPHLGTSSLSRLPPSERARHAAWLPQERVIAWPVSVETLVALGRTPHLGGGRRLGPDDRSAVERAILRTGLQNLRDRPATELSGGEKARVLIARALAQETPLLLADEPVAGLDPAQQIAAMGLFADLAAEGRGVLLSLHDLGLAARFCSRLLMLSEGRLVADGPPSQALTDARMREVFGVEAEWAGTARGRRFLVTGMAQ